MKQFFFLLTGIYCYVVSFAQFNDTTHYYVDYLSAGTINKTQNTSSYLLNNVFKFSVNEKSISLNSNSSWIYGRQEQLLTNNDFSSSLDMDVNKNLHHFYYWGLANYNKSYSLKINNRFQIGAGGAYNIINRKNAAFNISDGLLYENSNINLNDSTRDVYHTVRNSLRLKFRFVLKDIILLDGIDFLQNSLSNGPDYIIQSNTNLSIKLRKWLNLTVSETY